MSSPEPMLVRLAKGCVTRPDSIARWFVWYPRADGARLPWIVASYAAPRWAK